MSSIVYNAMVLREPYSGVEVTVHQLLCALARHGTLPIRAYVPSQCRALPESLRLEVRASRMGNSRLMRILWEQTCLPALLRKANTPLLHAPAYVAPLAAPCPTVLTVHDLHALTHPQFCTTANRLHYAALLPRSIRRAAAIIVFSGYTRQNIIRHFPETASRIAVIPPGLSPSFSRCTDAAHLRSVKAKYALPDDFLLFVGDLSARKNIGGLLAAFAHIRKRYPGIRLVLAGAGASIPQDHVQCTGYVEQADLPALYSLAQVFVFPSHDEGFGIPPLEAMACGCPVVCSGGAPIETCGAAALACDPTDPATIAAATLSLLDNPALRHEKAAAGYSTAAAFSWENAARATEEVYASVLGNDGKTE